MLTLFKRDSIKNAMQPTITQLTVLDLVPFGQTGPKSVYYALRLANPGWSEWHPGQFLMLRPPSFGLEYIWARPFSICHMNDRHLIVFFKVAGRGTQRLAELKNGDKVTVWGPLGNYFTIATESPTLLLAGGVGIAPFVGYVYRHPQPWNLSMLFGHKDPIGCFPVDSINERIPLDSLREQEPDDLDNFIFSIQEKMQDCAEQNGLTLACGPLPFLRCVQQFALKLGSSVQLSLENRMACGVGACLGCVCKTTDKWPVLSRRNMPVQVCTNGPVFWANQVKI